MTAYRYNVIGDELTCSVVEGETVELPTDVADHISRVTDKTWPETYWTPYGMTSFDYMSKIGPNHDANSFGLIGADLVTLNAMLRIPVDMNNVPKDQIFRPTLWDRYAGDDFRATRAFPYPTLLSHILAVRFLMKMTAEAAIFNASSQTPAHSAPGRGPTRARNRGSRGRPRPPSRSRCRGTSR